MISWQEKETLNEIIDLSVRNLTIKYHLDDEFIVAVDNVSFDIVRGQSLAIIGESGSGKTAIANAIVGLLPLNAEVSGEIFFRGVNLLTASNSDLMKIRGKQIGIIFQNSMSILNPSFTIGWQLVEVLRIHKGLNKKEAKREAIIMFDRVGLSNPSVIYYSYPHQLSGGMKQRATIAIALASTPALLIADEPTTALDVTVQAQILDLISSISKEMSLTLLLISHDLGIVSELAKDLKVMYAGEFVEVGLTKSVLKKPIHPYTSGLLSSLPVLLENSDEFFFIDGIPPEPKKTIIGCKFAGRCMFSKEICNSEKPAFREFDDGQAATCHFATGDRFIWKRL